MTHRAGMRTDPIGAGLTSLPEVTASLMGVAGTGVGQSR